MGVKDKKYYWLKLKRDFFKRHDIRIIESMPNGKDYILFYLKLLCESVDHEGKLRFSDTIPYSDAMLATITDTNVDVVRSAIKVFIELHMMDVMDDGTFYMCEVNKMIGEETYWAQQKRAQREKHAEVGQIPMLSNESPTCPSKRKSLEIEKEKDIKTKGPVFVGVNADSESPVTADGVITDQDDGRDKDVLSESPVARDGVIAEYGEDPDCGKKESARKAQKKEASILFEELWSIYPNKRGKGKISDAKKRAFLEIGKEQMERAIRRYVEEHDRKEIKGEFTPNWQHGSTFFNSGYIDYLDDNYSMSPASRAMNVKPNGFNNFEGSGTDWNAVADRIMQEQEREREAESNGQ